MKRRTHGRKDSHPGKKGKTAPKRPQKGGEKAGRLEAVRARFKEADKNSDGKLSRDEAPERLKARFSKIDADADGQITPEELKKAWLEKRKAAPQRKGPGRSPKAKRSSEQRKKAEAKKAQLEGQKNRGARDKKDSEVLKPPKP